MKKVFWIIGAVAFLISSCTSISMEEQRNFSNRARENEFSHYFPAISGERVFPDLDSAYNYMNEAIAKFGQVSAMQRAKGGGAVLSGTPRRNRDVRIVYYISAFGTNGQNTLTERTADVQREIRSSVGASVVFLIFTGEKSAAQMCYYLKSGYQFTNNAYQREFTAYGNKYTADYRPNWSVRQVFDYLRGNIN